MDRTDPKANPNENTNTDSCPHTPTKKRTEFKKRVNHYLYDNLNRVLCELYFYCEHESNAIQCSEVLNILSQASLQFHQLNRQLIILSNANIKNTKSISWNVSSLSPQKDDFCKFNQNNFKSNNIANVKKITNMPNITSVPNTPKNIPNNNNKSNNKSNNHQSNELKSVVNNNNNNESKQPEISHEIANEISPSTQNIKPAQAMKPKMVSKQKKTIKCWADYDSESDLDFESIKSECGSENEYEKYIQSDIRKSEIIRNNEQSLTNKTEIKQEKKEEVIINEPTELNNNKNEPQNMNTNINLKETQKNEEQSEEKEEEQTQQTQNEIIKPQMNNALNVIYTNKQKRWRQKIVETTTTTTNNNNNNNIKMTEQNKENMNENITEKDVWFPNECETVTLNDIMNDQSQNIINKYENNNNTNQKEKRKNHNFPLPFNKMVMNNNYTVTSKLKYKKSLFIDQPKNFNSNRNHYRNNKKIEKLIHKLSHSNRNNYRNMNRNEQLKKTQLKQEKAEKRRLQFREQQNNKWQIVAAKKKQKRDKLRQETEHKLLLQKTELNKKLNSAQMRYETKIKEKKLKAKQHDIKIKNVQKIKDIQLLKKREITKNKSEEKMKNAQKKKDMKN